MFRFGVLALLLCLSSLANSKKANYSGYQVIRVLPTEEKHLQLLNLLAGAYSKDLQFWNDLQGVNRPALVQLAPHLVSGFLEVLEAEGVSVKVVHTDLQKVVDEQKASRLMRLRSRARKEAFPLDVYHTLEEIYGQVDEWGKQFDDVKVSSIGSTVNDRPIKSLYIGSGDKKVIAIDCGIHAREWITPATCMYMLNDLLTNAESEEVKTLRERYDWLFVPVLNPDGYSYTWTDDRMWRKNLGSDFKAESNCGGVDLNRNSDANFGGGGSSPDPCTETYHGPSAFSEKETAAERDLFLPLKGRLVSFYSLHSFSQLWMSPYSYTAERPKEYDEQMRVAEIGVNALTATHGTKYEYGNTYSIIYQSSGSNRDWTFINVGPVYTYGLELRDKGEHGFLLPEDQILDTAEETWNGIRAASLAIPHEK